MTVLLLLSWIRFASPSTTSTPRPLPRNSPKAIPLRQSATKLTTRSDLALSQRFAGFLRGWTVSLLRLTADKRFATFPRSMASSLARRLTLWTGSAPFPQRGSHPSKNSPHLQPYRVTTAVAFLTLLLAPHLGTHSKTRSDAARSLTGRFELSLLLSCLVYPTPQHQKCCFGSEPSVCLQHTESPRCPVFDSPGAFLISLETR